MDTIICIAIIAVAAVACAVYFIYNQKRKPNTLSEKIMTEDDVLDKLVHRIADHMKDESFLNARTNEQYEAAYRTKIRIEEALTNCVDGDEAARATVKEMIISILTDELFPDVEDLYKVYPLNETYIESYWLFEILMERLYTQHGKKSLEYLIEKYHWNAARYDDEDNRTEAYFVNIEDLVDAYNAEMEVPITEREAYAVVATLNYAKYKGYGVVDTLRSLDIDGLNIGVSGTVLTDDPKGYDMLRSIWIYYKGVHIHLRFLAFPDEGEMRRVVQLLCRYNSPGALTAKRGYLINTSIDKSRILALRPPVAETWACIIRKFVLDVKSLDFLLDPQMRDPSTHALMFAEDGEPIRAYTNVQLVKHMIELLMLGQVTTGFTGRQGSGKTTLMGASLSAMDRKYNIRILELAPEMYAREMYPRRNIESVQETPTVSAEALQDALKKSDAAITIIGEVATDVVAARMIQLGRVASLFTVFSHHANRTIDLVEALAMSAAAGSGGGATYETMLPQVLDVVHVDVHMDYDVEGYRYIERVTEIVPLDKEPYPEFDPQDPHSMNKITAEYYKRRTDRARFTTRDILVFDPVSRTYKVALDENGKPQFFSDALVRHIFRAMRIEDRAQWASWILENWGCAV